jgi:hypothetical protein
VATEVLTEPVLRLYQQHVLVAKRVLDKAALAVAKVVFPHTNERIVVTESLDPFSVGKEVLTPRL